MNNGYDKNRNGRQMPEGGRGPRPQNRDPEMRGQRPQNPQGRPVRNPGINGGQQMPPRQAQGRPNQPERRERDRREPDRRQQHGNGITGQPKRTRSVTSTRRKATREQMKVENRRRRKEAFSLFLSRLALYGIILAVLAGIGAAVFFGFFYNTPDDNKASITYFESYDGKHTEKIKVSEDISYLGGVLYVNFTNIANGSDMSVILDSENAKFVLPDGEDNSDSAGTGREEYVSFTKDTTECTVCSQPARLAAKAVFEKKNVWVPASFVADYVNGITVEEDKDGGKVYITRDSVGEGDEMKLAEVSFKLKSAIPPDPAETDDVDTTGGMPEITFATDLSGYEQYMNPEDAKEYLVLVNKTTSVDQSYAPQDLINVVDTRQDDRPTQQMRETAAKALEAMFIEMREAGFTDVSVTSAYRSYEYQNQLYTQYTDQEMANNPALTIEQAQSIVDTYSAKPGTSEHQTGLCCDLHNLPSADKAFAEKPAYGWLSENAWKFGFIERFPEDKTEVTGYDYEPWHYRFVGRNAAWQIKSGELCLEEFLAK